MTEAENKVNEDVIMFMNKLREDAGELSEQQIEALKFYNALNEQTEITEEQQQFKLVCSILQEQTQRAAYFGAALMERVRALSEEVNQLNERIESRDAENDQLALQIANFDLERQTLIEKFQSFVQKMQEENNSIPELITERQSLLSSNEELKTQLHEAIETNKTLLADLKGKDDQIQKSKYLDRDNVDLISQNKLLSQTVENNKQEIAKYGEDIAELKKELTQLKLTNSKYADTISNLEMEIAEKRGDLQSKERDQSKLIADLNLKLKDAYNEIEKKAEKIEELKTQAETYTKQTTFTALENQKLSKDLAHQFKLLEQYRLTIDQLKRDAQSREEEPIIMGDEKKEEEGDSLFADLADHSFDPSPSLPPSLTPIAPPSDQPNNQIDYFFLAATAVKISMAIKSPVASEANYKINLRDLYDRALSLDVPFHEWYEWLVRELTPPGEQINQSPSSPSPSPKLSSPSLQSKLANLNNSKGSTNKSPPQKTQPKRSLFDFW